jgi:hypothetical protein
VSCSDKSGQVAYIFDDRDEESRRERATKRRRVSKKHASEDKAGEAGKASFFVPLLNGAESRECVELRERLYSRSWEEIHGRIQVRLHHCTHARTHIDRNKNAATLGKPQEMYIR